MFNNRDYDSILGSILGAQKGYRIDPNNLARI